MSDGKQGASRSTKDKIMAANLKKKGEQRTTGQCPLCHRIIPNGVIHAPALCQPRRRNNGRRNRAA